MTLHVIYTGAADHIGCIPGKQYYVDVREINGRVQVVSSVPMTKPCPYGSWAAFWRNWKTTKHSGPPKTETA